MSTSQKITREETRKLWFQMMEEGVGQFIWCEFVKRSTGELRSGLFRFGVTKELAGGPAAYDPKEKDLAWVWEVKTEAAVAEGKGGRKSIPIEGIKKFRLNKQEFEVID